ncbi:type VI secretion system baseplate subunit TssG [Pseudomonas sp. D47]|uniref:type VI secretion system baseplate subunit TssG n=1 Tax=Pseudomonas sp. D47 TaxID=3159447 RepID=UPI00387AA12A
MDAAHGVTAPDLTKLSRSIREYNLFLAIQRVMEQLQAANPSQELDEHTLYERLEFQGNPSLGFPGSDIDSLEFFEEHGVLRARMRLNLLSLVGANSPLPAFYAEQALNDTTTRDFLDLFNNRIQRLLLPIWRKYRYCASFQPEAVDSFSEQVFALIGLGSSALRDAPELDCKRLLPYLGLLSLRAHSAALIESVLRYYFKHPELFIEQCLEGTEKILDEQQNGLGTANNQLSENLILGKFVRDRGGKFLIDIKQLSWERFHEFLPIGAGYQPLCALTRFTLRDALAYDIRLELKYEEIRELRLVENNPCRLGWTSWLGQEQADGTVTIAGQAQQGLNP